MNNRIATSFVMLLLKQTKLKRSLKSEWCGASDLLKGKLNQTNYEQAVLNEMKTISEINGFAHYESAFLEQTI